MGLGNLIKKATIGFTGLCLGVSLLGASIYQINEEINKLKPTIRVNLKKVKKKITYEIGEKAVFDLNQLKIGKYNLLFNEEGTVKLTYKKETWICNPMGEVQYINKGAGFNSSEELDLTKRREQIELQNIWKRYDLKLDEILEKLKNTEKIQKEANKYAKKYDFDKGIYVFNHGIWGSRESWLKKNLNIIDVLEAKGNRVGLIKIDNRYFPKLNKRNCKILPFEKNKNVYVVESIDNQSSITSQGKALKKLLDNFKDKSVIYVGHSMGGCGIREYLANYEDNKLKKVVFVQSPVVNGSIEDPKGFVENFANVGLHIFKNMNSDAARDLMKNSIYFNGGNEKDINKPIWIPYGLGSKIKYVPKFNPDVNDDGVIGIIKGINQKTINENIEYVCVIGNYQFNLKDKLPDQKRNGDGVVDLYSQDVNNISKNIFPFKARIVHSKDHHLKVCGDLEVMCKALEKGTNIVNEKNNVELYDKNITMFNKAITYDLCTINLTDIERKIKTINKFYDEIYVVDNSGVCVGSNIPSKEGQKRNTFKEKDIENKGNYIKIISPIKSDHYLGYTLVKIKKSNQIKEIDLIDNNIELFNDLAIDYLDGLKYNKFNEIIKILNYKEISVIDKSGFCAGSNIPSKIGKKFEIFKKKHIKYNDNSIEIISPIEFNNDYLGYTLVKINN